jgi:hypothetical protein
MKFKSIYSIIQRFSSSINFFIWKKFNSDLEFIVYEFQIIKFIFFNTS